MFSNCIVVVIVIKGFSEEFLSIGDLKDPGNIKLIVICAVGALKMGVLFGMFEVILDELTIETRKQFSEFVNLIPGPNPKLFPVIDGVNELNGNAVTP